MRISRRETVTPKHYRQDVAPFLPGVSTVQMSMMPMPDPALTNLGNGLRDKANDHVAQMLQTDPGNVGQ